MKFQIVTNKARDSERFDADNGRLAFTERGYEVTGVEMGPRLRDELRGQPKVKGLCGPMWGGEQDGEPVIRYEDWDSYEILSR